MRIDHIEEILRKFNLICEETNICDSIKHEIAMILESGKERVANKELTLDDLLKMELSPVWAVREHSACWEIISEIDVCDNIIYFDSDIYQGESIDSMKLYKYKKLDKSIKV